MSAFLCVNWEDIAHLDLYVKHRPRVDPEAERRLDVLRQALLVALLDRRPPFLERGVLSMFEKTLSRPVKSILQLNLSSMPCGLLQACRDL